MNPFRELFVEVPRQLLEAAVAEAKSRRRPTGASYTYGPSSVIERLRKLPWAIIAADLFGWTSCSVTRSAYTDDIIIEGMSACRHRQRVEVSEIAVMAAREIREIVDAIVREVDAQRACYCVQAARP